MKLIRYKIEKFRSIDKTEWIDVDDVTALIGTNESGKTNALLPLWKLSPANGGEIDLVADLPRAQYKDYRSEKRKPVFIYAEYELTEDESTQLANITSKTASDFSRIIVLKDFDGNLFFEYPRLKESKVTSEELDELLSSSIAAIESQKLKSQAEEQRKNEAINLLSKIASSNTEEVLTIEYLSDSMSKIQAILQNKVSTSASHGLLETIYQQLKDWEAELKSPSLTQNDELKAEIVKLMPKYVYYSNYGNLDSRIYLPTVINELNRKDLTEKEAAKVRTIKTLFDFVRLNPQEILEL